MTLRELADIGMIKDNDFIRINMEVSATLGEIKSVGWFVENTIKQEDELLEIMDTEIIRAGVNFWGDEFTWDICVARTEQLQRPGEEEAMTLKELIESCLVKDDHNMMIHIPVFGNVRQIQCGRWFEDQILELHDRKIDSLRFNGHEWDVDLQFREE